MRTLLTERELQFIWLAGLYRRRGLLTEDGRSLEVFFPGFPGAEGGPDFRAARLGLAGEVRVGDVELHLTPSGWQAHGHTGNPAYAAVILHVALRRDVAWRQVTRADGDAIPELILEPYLEGAPMELRARLGAVMGSSAGEHLSFERLGEERVEARVQRLRRQARDLGIDGALYRELMVGLGYRANTPGFSELARLVPWSSLTGRPSAEPRAVYERWLPHIVWRRYGRPANHPLRRLEGWVRFVRSVGGEGLLATFATDLERAERRLDPDGTGAIGGERAHDLVVNAVLPALVAFGGEKHRTAAWERLRKREVGPSNRRLREAAQALGVAVPSRTIDRLGLLEWRARQ